MKSRKMVKWYKITAQVFGLLVCCFFMAFIIGEGIPDIINGRGDDLLPVLPVLLFPVAGYLVTWFKEWHGAVIMIAGAITLLFYFLITGELKMAFIYGLPFLAGGALFLFHLAKEKSIQ